MFFQSIFIPYLIKHINAVDLFSHQLIKGVIVVLRRGYSQKDGVSHGEDWSQNLRNKRRVLKIC